MGDRILNDHCNCERCDDGGKRQDVLEAQVRLRGTLASCPEAYIRIISHNLYILHNYTCMAILCKKIITIGSNSFCLYIDKLCIQNLSETGMIGEHGTPPEIHITQ